MALNFPSSPTEGQVFNASRGVSYVYRSGVWRPAPLKTALPMNYIINPSMTASQQNGDTGPTAVASGSWYQADQWLVSWGLTGATMTCGRYRPTPSNGDSVFATMSTANASIGAGDYVQIIQRLEGQRIAEFNWGTAAAQQAVFRFSVLSDVAGTYSAFIKNLPSGDRTFLAPFTITTAYVWTPVSVVVPGCTDSTWPKDNAAGMELGVGLASGTTYGGGVAGWQNANKVQLAGNTVFSASVKTFHLADVGFYLDPYQTGVAPPFEMPEHNGERIRCTRYWYKGLNFNGPVVAATITRGGNRHPVPMRATPAAAIAGTPKLYELSVNIPITSLASACNNYGADFQFTASAGGMTVGRQGINLWVDSNQYLAMDARM